MHEEFSSLNKINTILYNVQNNIYFTTKIAQNGKKMIIKNYKSSKQI